MSALQTNINTLMSANSVDELKSRLVAILTTIAETPAGSGITAVTSDDGSISIDNTDPSAPDLSIPFGIWTPVISQESANITANITGLDGSNTYFQVGSIVFYTMILVVTISSGTAGTFETTIPVPSIFNNGSQGSAGFSGILFNEDLGFLKKVEISTNGSDGGLLISLDWQNDSSGGFSLYIIGQYNVQS